MKNRKKKNCALNYNKAENQLICSRKYFYGRAIIEDQS